MRYIKGALFLVLAVAGILFGVSNQENATVHFFWYAARSFPLYLVLFACFLAGTCIAILYGFISSGDRDQEESRLKKRLAETSEELRKVRSRTAQPTPPPDSDGTTGKPAGRP